MVRNTEDCKLGGKEGNRLPDAKSCYKAIPRYTDVDATTIWQGPKQANLNGKHTHLHTHAQYTIDVQRHVR